MVHVDTCLRVVIFLKIKRQGNSTNNLHQKSWLNSFIELASMHRDFRIGISELHPEIYLGGVIKRLAECLYQSGEAYDE